MIRRCTENDINSVHSIINDGASAYKGVIPEDCRHEPYMSVEYLRHELEAGVVFWGYPAPWYPPAPAGGGKRFLATVKKEAPRVSSSGRSRYPGEPLAPAGGGSTEQGDELVGVMGIQDVRDVTLIRHAYVRTRHRNAGIGGKLISHLKAFIEKPALVGTWAAAAWAIRFYEKHGFRMVSAGEKDRLLRTYWMISERQTETSVVLADQRWFEQFGRERSRSYSR